MRGQGSHVYNSLIYLLPIQDKGMLGKALRACKWKLVSTFQNSKTENVIKAYHKVLVKPPKFSKKKYKSKFLINRG